MRTYQALPLLFFAACHTNLTAASLEIDKDKSRVQVDAKATGHSFTGTLENYSAAAKGNPATTEPDAFDLKWNFKDLKTGDEKRDKEMIAWLGGGNPKGAFHFGKSWVDAKGTRHAMGELKIHGASKTVSFPFTASKDGDWITIDGKAGMNYKDFGLPLIRSMALMTVDPQLTVRFHVVGKIK